MASPLYFIQYSDSSIEDLREIKEHYREINIIFVGHFRDALLATQEEIIRNPFAFSKVNYKDFRRIIIKKFSYKIIYRVEDNIIRVFCITHFSRSSRFMKKRLRK